MRWLPSSAVFLALGLGLSACSEDIPAPTAALAPAVDTFTVAASSSDAGFPWDGVVQAVEQSLLSAQTSGRVLALGADVGERVAKGATLLRLTGEEQAAAASTARAQLRSAEAQLADAANRFRRAEELIGRQLISRDEFDRVRAAHDSGLAARDAAAAQLAQAEQQLGYTVVRAPYAGVIASRHVEQGETVAPGQPLFTLYAPGALRVAVQVPQADAAAIRQGGTAEVLLPDGRRVQAVQLVVFPGADPLAHSTTVRVLLPRLDAAPLPGQAAKVYFAAAAAQGLWLPTSAVVERGELSAVYVVQGADIQLRQLRLGRRAGDRVEVLAGLAPGEQVATDPVAALRTMREHHAEARQ